MPVQNETSFLDGYQDMVIQIAGVEVTPAVMLACIVAVVCICSVLLVAHTSGRSGKTCSARHILMANEQDLLKAKSRIDGGEDFCKVAKECSTCPSGQSGGSLGCFTPGSMVPAFDRVCFAPDTEVGKLYGPIQTHFGYHLIIVDERSGCEMDVGEGAKNCLKEE
ncbi:unnamed protein product [Prorocentrum cordatum]|uniref:Peptidyl-prolyl cis-trans isomerase n=1 Tax=Prorocentrum cordatum TaxID=2364126 RepID=A0ABN9PTB6_9DINO|nr:unnamed protein product [Polarella glacialis]